MNFLLLFAGIAAGSIVATAIFWKKIAVAVSAARQQAEYEAKTHSSVLEERLLARNREIEQKNTSLADLSLKIAELQADKADGQVEISRLTEKLANQTKAMEEAKDAMKSEFAAAATKALNDSGQTFLGLAKGQLEVQQTEAANSLAAKETAISEMLKPVQETIKQLDRHVEASNVARSTAEALLNDQIERLAGASESLSNALRKPVIRGNWGQMTLENALANAGLQDGIDFTLQHTTDGEGGSRRTDAIVNLPKGRKLIIDSKNLMESYIAYSAAEDPTQKALFAAAHSKSLRSHIKDLSSKEYWKRYEGLDCVILFIPHDGMYHAAIQDEAELMRDACEKRVFVTNPMSLIPLLRAVGYVLDQERANENATEIQQVGIALYAELTRFAINIGKVGSKLHESVMAYNNAIPGLDRFIVSKARSLKQFGAAKGEDPELPETVDLEPRLFSSRELKTANPLLQTEEEKTILRLSAAEDTVDKKPQ